MTHPGAGRGDVSPGRPDRPGRLGRRPAGPGQRREPRPHAGLRPAAGGVPARRARRVRPGRGTAAGPDGQLRGRPPQHRRRPRRLPGPHAHQPRDRGRQLLREPRPAPGVRQGRGPRQPAAPHGPGLRRRRAQRHGPPRGLPRAGRTREGPRRRGARLPRRPRHAAAERQGLPRHDPGGHGPARRRPLRRRSAAATTRWTATRAGTASSWPTTLWSTARGSSPPTPRRRSTPPTRAARTTSSCGRRSSRRSTTRACATATSASSSTSAPTARASSRAPSPSRASPSSTAARTRRAVDFVTMTQYKKEFPLPVAFPPEHPEHVLADVLAEHGLRQLHIAETEKYAHVTFFFNGGVEKAVEGEERILVPSPRDVPTYDHKPEMSAVGVTDELVAQLGDGRVRLRRRQLRQRRHGRAHRHHLRGRARRSRPSTPAWAASSTPSTASAASASSPPTTATRTTCWSRTAAPTRRTAPTWCRSSRPSRARACARAAGSATWRRPSLALLGVAQPPEMTGADLLEPAG